MDRKFIYCFTIILTGVFVGLIATSENSVAADCKALRNQSARITSLLKRRDFLQQAVSVCQEDPILNYNYGKTLERLRKYEDALKYYSIASRYESTRAKAFFGMGDIFVNLSKPQKAVKAYEHGLETDPKDERARKSLADLRKKYNIKESSPPSPEPAPTPKPVPVEVEKAHKPPTPKPAPPAAEKGPDLDFQTPFRQ